MTDQRNDGLHPKHPGRGKTGVIELESGTGKVEHGGFAIFLPSGATKLVHWQSAAPITPTLDAAKQYATEVVESLLQQHGGNPGTPDIAQVNWTSITAAIQRVILDFNHKLQVAARDKMARDLVGLDGKPLLH